MLICFNASKRHQNDGVATAQEPGARNLFTERVTGPVVNTAIIAVNNTVRVRDNNNTTDGRRYELYTSVPVPPAQIVLPPASDFRNNSSIR